MRWPWVSRSAFELLLDERDRLRARNDHLEDSLIGIQRVRHGMRETPRPAKQTHAPEPIPEQVRAIYEGFNSKAVRDDIARQCRELRAGGTPWVEIQRALERQLGLEEVEA